MTDAVECWQQMVSEMAGNMDIHGEQANWVSGQELCLPSVWCLFDPHLIDFKQRCAKTLVRPGDAAVDAQRHDDALTKYSTALLLDLAIPQIVLTKRSKVFATVGLWANALKDAKQVRITILRRFSFNVESLGYGTGSSICMGIRERFDRVGKSKSHRRFVEGRLGKCWQCKYISLLMRAVKITL